MTYHSMVKLADSTENKILSILQNAYSRSTSTIVRWVPEIQVTPKKVIFSYIFQILVKGGTNIGTKSIFGSKM